MERNVRTSADHRLELVAGEEGEERHRHDPRHPLPDARDDGVEFVKPEVDGQLDVLASVLGGDAGVSKGEETRSLNPKAGTMRKVITRIALM